MQVANSGFYLKIWDKLWKCQYEGPCECAHCEKARGNREYHQWLKIKKYDYSVLLDWRFWIYGSEEEQIEKADKAALEARKSALSAKKAE